MIWVREGRVWYGKELIDKIKEILHKRPYNAIEKVIKMIEEEEKCINVIISAYVN